MIKPYEFVKAIRTKNYELFDDPLAEKDYNPYVVNQGLSFSMDSVMYANEMNMRPNIPKMQQFDFLMRAVPKNKKWVEWIKKEAKPDALNIVVEYYGCSFEKAEEYLSILTDEQITMLEKLLFKGGK